MPKTVYHLITPDATHTFITKESFDEAKTEDHPENGFVYAESQVSDEEYERLQSWHIEGDEEVDFDESLGDA